MNKDQLTAIHNLLYKTQEIHRCHDGELETPISFWELWCRIDEIASTENKKELEEIAAHVPWAVTMTFESGNTIEAGELHSTVEETFAKN